MRVVAACGILGLLLFCSAAFGQTEAPAKPGKRAVAAKPAEDFAAEIKRIRETWVKEFNAGHADKVAALYGPEAVLMRWNGSVHGPDAIRGDLQLSIDHGTSGYWFSSLRSEHSADLGFDTGAYNLTLKNGRTIEGNYVVVVKRIAGEWKIAAHAMTANPNPPPQQ